MAYFFSSLALIIAVSSFFYLRFFILKRTSAERLNEQILSETRETIRQMIDDIDRVTDRDAQLVERRVEDLKALLTDADRRIGVFSRELETRTRRDAAYAELGKKNKLPARESDPGTLFDPPVIEDSKKPEETEAGVHTTSKQAPATNLSRQEHIILLAAKGLTPAQIAAKLNMTITEVEMILVLHTKYA